MKIGIIGTGISGLTAAYLLHSDYEITVFEKNNYIGGHTNTIDVTAKSKSYAVDTGFIVFNKRTYPNFLKLMCRLNIPWQKSDMSFSVSNTQDGIEYSSKSLNTLFANKKNLFNLAFWNMIKDILKFRRMPTDLLRSNYMVPLDTFLAQQGYCKYFREYFLNPMGASIWSAEPGSFGQIPLGFFYRFFNNHGLLTLTNQPQWLTIKGGSKEYVNNLTATFKGRINLNSSVKSVRRQSDSVIIRTQQGEEFSFDHVILAVHSDQALAMLVNSTQSEREILSAIPYQKNQAVLHFDINLLPAKRKVWASWNYLVPQESNSPVGITYWMNSLQSIESDIQFCVTLNQSERIDSDKIYYQTVYEHPVYTRDSVSAQKRHGEISGKDRIHFCGAYWGNGFHEDGVNSALAVCRYFGKGLE